METSTTTATHRTTVSEETRGVKALSKVPGEIVIVSKTNFKVQGSQAASDNQEETEPRNRGTTTDQAGTTT